MLTTLDQSTLFYTRKLGRALAAVALSTLALAALPALAQGSASTSASGKAATVSRDDGKLMVDLAHANLAEIESGKLALQKSQSTPVKTFAQQMVDDHTAALKELQTLAQSKGVKLPDSPDMKHKTMAAALKVMNGTGFDNQYMKRAGVNDHEQTVALLQKVEKTAKDPELKTMATKMMPTVEHHLEMAQQSMPKVADKK